MMHSMTLRVTTGVVWVAAITATVFGAFATRSSGADVNPAGGVFIVVGCFTGVCLGIALIRPRIVLVITAIAGAVLASRIAWSVLHDESSTAALGVVVPPFINGVIASAGAGIGWALSRRGKRASRS